MDKPPSSEQVAKVREYHVRIPMDGSVYQEHVDILLRRILHLERGINILRNLHAEKHAGMRLAIESALDGWERIEMEANQ